MKQILSALIFFSTISAAQGAAMKFEGSCTGNLKDGTAVGFSYYSNFDGCKEKSKAAISFTPETHLGLYTGKRSFKNGKDIYSFKQKENDQSREVYRVVFADSTGNTSGILRYEDLDGNKQSVAVQCEIRDYEYADCES